MACQLPCTLEDAIALFEQIPAIASLYDRNHAEFVETLLESTAGRLPHPDSTKVYRVYYAAMLYLQQSPDNWRIKKHHKTELNDYSQAIAMLAKMQSSQDLAYSLAVPPGQAQVVSSSRSRLAIGSSTLQIDSNVYY